MKRIPLLLFLSLIMVFSLIPATSTQALSDSPIEGKMIYETASYPIVNQGIEYSPQKNQAQYNEIKKKMVYSIMDQDGTLYCYKTKLEYEKALKSFDIKWSSNQIEAATYTALYHHSNYRGWFLDVPVGRAYNLTGGWNDSISSLKTASNGRGTTVCFHKNGGEPCKTYAPGVSISYVGDGWNDQITYVYVRP
ncbi:hypothetical protein [Hazenella coriacea]|uniref:Uncharacterized protein n=1 Tax=Hazenella coriacea TaxID=1179467 RepID=A0A4R3L9T2_9BACL|nr:hypothetical protein [Hazenella coriacea]TCS95988.1 hypothetical protein EDD58_102572 [Hazenella coriacea]